MATLAPQSITGPTGRAITLSAAAAGGDKMAPGRNAYLMIRNDSASSITVTLDTTDVAFNGSVVPDTALAVAAGATSIIPVGPEYGGTIDGLASIAYSAATSVTVAAVTS